MKFSKELLLKYKEVILYLIFGILTTLINIVTYYLCDKIGLSTAVSTVIAWVLSVLFAFITNKIFVFASKTYDLKKLFKEIISFFTMRVLTGILDLVIMIVFVDILHLNGLLIKILSNIIVIILNYVFSKVLVFKNKNQT